MTKITVAALQLAFTDDTAANIKAVADLVREAHSKGAEVVLPPELFEKRMTMKARSSGRGFMSGHGDDGRRGAHDGRSRWSFRGPG